MHVDDLILLATSDDFGVGNLHIAVRADQGNLVESGDALEGPPGSGIWNYFATVAVASGTQVIVDAFATDCLGGVGTLSEWITIP